MYQRCVMMGHIASDIHLEYVQGDIPVCAVSLAVDRPYKRNGEKVSDFFRVVCWRGLAEFVAKNFTKGRLILVDGRMEVSTCTDREGIRRQRADLIAEHVSYAGLNKGKSPLPAQPPSAGKVDEPESRPEPKGDFEEFPPPGDEDLPF